MRLPLIYNPRSGPGGKDPERLLRCLPGPVRARIEPTPMGPPWDYVPLIEQAKAAGGPLLVWGGDGTLHHAGRALVGAGCPVPLAALPGGSGNGLVRGLRTPVDPAAALAALLDGRELRMDLPRMDGVPFLNVCGTGFEATVAHAFDSLEGRGFWNYARLSLRIWRSQPLANLAWSPESHELPREAWSLCLANLPQYGSGLWIAPGADPTDGALQWATLRCPGFLELGWSVPRLFLERGHTSLRREGRLRATEVRLGMAMAWQLDGEPAAARDRAEFSVEPRAFRMQVTRACPWG